jgi:putative transposase
VKQVIVLKLEPDPEQHQALLDTLEAFNAGCQYAADVAYEKRCANKVALQPLVYGSLRERFGLSSQMAIRAIAKAVEAYKRDKRVHVRFQPQGAMVYDQRIMSFKGLTHVSLLSLSGRLLVPMRYGAYQAARLDRAQGQADLMFRDGAFFLAVTIDLPKPPESDPNVALGVDLGIAEIATDSDGHRYSGEAVKTIRRRVKRIRRLLQAKGTKSARQHLKKIRRRQSRFVRNSNHVIAKQLVERAAATGRALALEDLKGIRERSNGFSRETRWLMGNWAFDQLAQFVRYKAEAAGVPVIVVDPRNTSRTCSTCGYCDKANRQSQAQFLCRQCGLSINADLNAALNIQARAHPSERLLSRPGPSGQPGTSHAALAAVVI